MTSVLATLGGGRIVRRATEDDIESLAELHAAAWGSDPASFHPRLRDLLLRPHPRFSPAEMTVVEDVGSRQLLSAQHMTRHIWRQGGLELPVAEIEMVATHPDHRRSGFVRVQTEIMERWATADRIPILAINGIPWFYTELGFSLGFEKWNGPASVRQLWPWAPREPADVVIRSAGIDDAGFIADVYDAATSSLLFAYERTVADWVYELTRSEDNPWYRQLLILESDGEPIGFASVDRSLEIPSVDALELVPDVSWAGRTRAVLAALHDHTRSEVLKLGWLGSEHPARSVEPSLFVDDPSGRSGAWYLKIPDMVGYLEMIRPVLEERLRGSDVEGYGGSIGVRLDGRNGISLTIREGVLEVGDWVSTRLLDGDVKLSTDHFMKILSGVADLESLQERFPYEVMSNDVGRAILRTLFPLGRSWLLPVY